MIANSGHDESGKYHSGKAGDQTGQEWAIINWYARGWNYVFRHPDKRVREWIAMLAEEAAFNDKIGYDQYERTSFWTQLKAAGYRPSKITKACEADCSAGVAAIVKATGYLLDLAALENVSADMYTGSERMELKAAGFQVLTDQKYMTSDKYLMRGDILLYEGHHTAINLTDGAAVSQAGITDFVERMYEVVLGRDPDAAGAADWIARLKSGQPAADIIYGFFLSKEYRETPKTDEEFVKDLYRGLFNREPDEEGLQTWITMLQDAKKKIIDGFVRSQEFLTFCSQYGIR